MGVLATLDHYKWAIAFGLLVLWAIMTFYNLRVDFAKYWDYLDNPYTPSGKKLYFISPMKLAIGDHYPWLAGFLGFENKETPIFFYMLMTQFGSNVSPRGTLTPYQMVNGIAPSPEQARKYIAPTKSGYWPAGSDRNGWVSVLNKLGQSLNADGTPKPTEAHWSTDTNNFLYQEYGISGNSKMIINFLDNSDPSSFATVMGEWGTTPSMQSGFIGFMEYNNQTWGAFDAYNYIFGTTPTKNEQASKTCPAGSKAQAGVGLATSMIGPMGVGAMFGPEGAAVGALVGLGIGLVTSFTNPNPCKRL